MSRSIRIIPIIVLLFVILSPADALLSGEVWEKTTEDKEHGIDVYTRTVEGSQIRAYQGRTTVEASLDALVSLMSDAASFPLWMHNVNSARVLEIINDKERITYVSQGVPWPVKDRDLVLYSELKINPDTGAAIINIEAWPDAYPEQEGHLRITEMKSSWAFTPKENGMVEVVYETYVDPGGRIPPSLVNVHTLDTPLNSLRGLREMIKRPEYRDAYMDVLHKD